MEFNDLPMHLPFMVVLDAMLLLVENPTLFFMSQATGT